MNDGILQFFPDSLTLVKMFMGWYKKTSYFLTKKPHVSLAGVTACLWCVWNFGDDYFNFTAESHSGRIMQVSQHLVTLQIRVL